MASIRYLNSILTVLAVLLALQVWVSFSSGPELATPAYAQGIPDSGAQRQQIVDQLKLLNRRTAEMTALMKSGKLRVLVTEMPNDEDEIEDRPR